ncbi:MAG TPA: CHAT domain-containing protein [Gemmatimonadaceae bacterium]
MTRPVALARFVALAAIIASAGCTGSRGGEHDDAEPLAALESLEAPRTMAPRLAIPTTYRACTERAPAAGTIPQWTCEASGADTVPSDRVLDIAARAAAAVRRDAGPSALRAAALVDLLWGGDGGGGGGGEGAGSSLDRSISYLQSAARVAEHPAPALVDLAAAHLARASSTGNPRDLLEALDAGERAVELDPASAPARFDVALALDWLTLDAQAARAWRAYLAVDPTSGWAREAERRLVALAPGRRDAASPSAPGGPDEPTNLRVRGWEEVLADWGRAVLRGDSAAAARHLALAEALGDTLARRGGDRSLGDAVRVIRSRAGRRAALVALARGHEAYAEGQVDFRAGRYAAAGREYDAALAAASGSVTLESWASVGKAATLLYAGRGGDAERVLRRVLAEPGAARHPAMMGRAWWALGTTLARRGLLERALAVYDTAGALYARAGERENIGALQCLTTEARFLLGQTSKGWVAMHRSLTTLRPYRSSVWLHSLLDVSARAAEREGLLRAALALQNEGVQVASRTGRAIDAAEARLARALLIETAGELIADQSVADSDVAIARAIVDTLPPGDQRGWYASDLRLAEAARSFDVAPARAVAALDSVVDYFAGQRNPARLLPALIARARGWLALGDATRAMADLDRAARLIDAERAAIDRAPLRASLLDAARGLFDRVVMLYADAGRTREALARLEMARAALTPTAAGAGAGAGAGATTREPSLAPPPGEVAAEYALIGDTLLAWTVSGDGVQLARATVDAAGLRRTIEHVRAAAELRADAAALRPPLDSLYERLIAPIRSRLGAVGTPIVLVADGALAGVPFAALHDAARDRYLVQDHPLRFALSLEDARRPAPAAPGGAGTALLVADPAFDARTNPGLAPLAGALREVRAIAPDYAHHVVLAGEAASRDSVVPALRSASVFHFAGHAIFDDANPDQSRLVLAPARPDTAPGESSGAVSGAASGAAPGAASGALTAAEIATLDLRRTRLVVLSACETQRSASGHAGGLAGLAGAFRVAGAGGVIGSQWRVDDAFTAALMTEFHRAYSRTGNAPGALRAAQLQLLAGPDSALRSPAAWAAFRYVGG